MTKRTIYDIIFKNANEGLDMNEHTLKIVTYDGRYNDILGVNLPPLDIIQSTGLKKHISKRHPDCLKYLDKIADIISDPDYIGISPRETNSFELIKQYDENVLIGIKLDMKNSYYYVATLHDIKQSKINNRLHSGRLKKLKIL